MWKAKYVNLTEDNKKVIIDTVMNHGYCVTVLENLQENWAIIVGNSVPETLEMAEKIANFLNSEKDKNGN